MAAELFLELLFGDVQDRAPILFRLAHISGGPLELGGCGEDLRVVGKAFERIGEPLTAFGDPVGGRSSGDGSEEVLLRGAVPVHRLVESDRGLAAADADVGSGEGAAYVGVVGISLRGHLEDSDGALGVSLFFSAKGFAYAPGGPEVAVLLLLGGRKLGAVT
jgi:hypothetical protein